MTGKRIPDYCFRCGEEVADGDELCPKCINEAVYEYVHRSRWVEPDEENGQMAHDCSMCGKYCASVDKNGHCSQCRQVWNS